MKFKISDMVLIPQGVVKWTHPPYFQDIWTTERPEYGIILEKSLEKDNHCIVALSGEICLVDEGDMFLCS